MKTKHRFIFASLRYARNFGLLLLISSFLAACSLPMFSKKSSEDEIVLQKNPCVVLALPSSGPYSPIAAKIRDGVKLASSELIASGIHPRVVELNTEATDWLQKLEALPAECSVVGGPMQEKAYLQARNSGATSRRTFFAFMANLQNNDEGIHAWRFFPGAEDQVKALVNFAVDDLGIRRIGAFYPDDNYGRRMTGLLENALASKNATLQKTSYNPAASGTWNKLLAGMIQPESVGKNRQPIPHTSFEAIFLPDSWKQMDKVTTSLLYNGEDRLVLLGTTLWEQGLAGKQIPKAGKYSLAVFPASWDKSRSPKALQTANSDFWTALGFDFLKFAVNTGIISRLDNARVVSRANHASAAIHALMPLSYDSRGMAHQKMEIFQISPSGTKPVDIDSFRQRRQSVQEQAALRMQTSRENAILESEMAQEESSPLREETVPAANVEGVGLATETGSNIGTGMQPAPAHVNYPTPTLPPENLRQNAPSSIPQRQIMSPVPQPSYKLRLPAKRP